MSGPNPFFVPDAATYTGVCTRCVARAEDVKREIEASALMQYKAAQNINITQAREYTAVLLGNVRRLYGHERNMKVRQILSDAGKSGQLDKTVCELSMTYVPEQIHMWKDIVRRRDEAKAAYRKSCGGH